MMEQVYRLTLGPSRMAAGHDAAAGCKQSSLLYSSNSHVIITQKSVNSYKPEMLGL